MLSGSLGGKISLEACHNSSDFFERASLCHAVELSFNQIQAHASMNVYVSRFVFALHSIAWHRTDSPGLDLFNSSALKGRQDSGKLQAPSKKRNRYNKLPNKILEPNE